LEWINKSRTLEKSLEKHSKQGVRLKLIREARNRIADFKGQYSFKEVASELAKVKALTDDARGRKILKRFESGMIKIPVDKEPVVSLLKILDVTPEFAGYNNEEEVKEKESKPKPVEQSSESSFEATAQGVKLNVSVINTVEERPITLYFKYYERSNPPEIEVIIFGDEPASDKFKKKSTNICRTGEVWVSGKTIKFSDSPKSIEMVGEASVSL
jgi:hypothetical protein